MALAGLWSITNLDPHITYTEEANYYNRLKSPYFKNTPEDDIQSSGYVVDTLEASIWCLLNTHSYRDCVLKAVNLGGDTDTTACVAGGLAGLVYGLDSIPKEWIDAIHKLSYIEELCEKFYKSLVEA